jgi:transposase-like protein
MSNFKPVNMKKGRRKFTAAFKAKVSIEALKERESLADLSARFEVHPTMISKWKQEFLELSSQVFENKKATNEPDQDIEKLYSKIGRLEMENDFLKKSLKRTGL